MCVIKNDSVPPPVCQFHLVCAAPNKCVWQFVRLFYRANFADRGTLLHDMRTDCSVKLTLLPCTRKLPSGLSFLYAQRELNIQTYISFRQTYFPLLCLQFLLFLQKCWQFVTQFTENPANRTADIPHLNFFITFGFLLLSIRTPSRNLKNTSTSKSRLIGSQIASFGSLFFWHCIPFAALICFQTETVTNQLSLTTGCGAILKSSFFFFPVYEYIVEKLAGFTWTGFKAQAE